MDLQDRSRKEVLEALEKLCVEHGEATVDWAYLELRRRKKKHASEVIRESAQKIRDYLKGFDHGEGHE